MADDERPDIRAGSVPPERWPATASDRAADRPVSGPLGGPARSTSGVERSAVVESARRATAQAVELRRRLHELSNTIPTTEEHAARLVSTSLALLGASAALVARVASDGRHLVLDGSVNVPAGVLEVHESTRLDGTSLLAEAARSDHVITCGTREEILARDPGLAALVEAMGVQALSASPVQHLGVTRGVLVLLYTSPRTASLHERAQLRLLGTRYARALHHARLYFAERDAHAAAERAWRETEEARAELERAHTALEQRIVERTMELAQANDVLTAVIDERSRAETERNALRQQLASAEEDERRRLARELHDQLGQHLTALALGLEDARRLASPDAAVQRRLTQLEELTRMMTRDVRHLALELRPPELDDVGLDSALRTYVSQWTARYGVVVDLAVSEGSGYPPLPADVRTTLYRIAQEALTNVARHAQATAVSMILERLPGEVRLLIEDDGRGFDVEATRRRVAVERRLGLAGMRERAELVGGTLVVESSPEAGTTLYVRLPVDAAPTPAP